MNNVTCSIRAESRSFEYLGRRGMEAKILPSSVMIVLSSSF